MVKWSSASGSSGVPGLLGAWQVAPTASRGGLKGEIGPYKGHNRLDFGSILSYPEFVGIV